MNFFRTILFLWLSLVTMALQAETLRGHVTLNDTLDGHFATIHIRSLGVTAVANSQGDYHILNIAPGRYEMECSFIGYTTTKTTAVVEDGKMSTCNVNLTVQPVDLPAAFVLPNNQDPAQYILKKMWAKSKQDRKKVNFESDLHYEVSAHNFDFLMPFVPKIVTNMFMMVARMMGMATVVKTAFTTTDLDVEVGLHRSYKNGKATDSNRRILAQNISLDEKQRKAFMESDKFLEKNLYDETYSSDFPWSKSNSSNKHFKYTGSYIENDRYVDVLSYENKKGRSEVHIIEEDWAVLKGIYVTDDEVNTIECRKVNGYYLPVSRISSFQLFAIPIDSLKKAVAKMDTTDIKNLTDKDGKRVKLSKQDKKKYEKMSKELHRLAERNKDVRLELNWKFAVDYKK